MTHSDVSRQERAAQMRQAKRYKAAMERCGYCAACLHRERGYRTAFGLSVCGTSRERIYEHCQRDQNQPKFQVDDTVLARFRDAN